MCDIGSCRPASAEATNGVSHPPGGLSSGVEKGVVSDEAMADDHHQKALGAKMILPPTSSLIDWINAWGPLSPGAAFKRHWGDSQ